VVDKVTETTDVGLLYEFWVDTCFYLRFVVVVVVVLTFVLYWVSWNKANTNLFMHCKSGP
jgi:hypothetical protein